MRIVILFEFSGIVRDAFIVAGHEAISCDLLPTERPGPHIQGDCRNYDWSGYDLVIAHPPCTHTAVSGARWFKEKIADGRQQEGIALFFWVTKLKNEKVVIEHPRSIMSTIYRKPDQYIQPWMFGHGEKKTICLWLKGVNPLIETNRVAGREEKVFRHVRSWKDRSRFYPGIAAAMAEQWGPLVMSR
jgi:site-specific DNA-cytosine methylase